MEGLGAGRTEERDEITITIGARSFALFTLSIGTLRSEPRDIKSAVGVQNNYAYRYPEIYPRMPREPPSFHTFRALSGRTTRTRSSNLRETSTRRSQACRKMAEALLASMQIREEGKAEHSSSSCHIFVPARQQSPSAKY